MYHNITKYNQESITLYKISKFNIFKNKRKILY